MFDNLHFLRIVDLAQRAIQRKGVETFTTRLLGWILILAIVVSWLFPSVYDYVARLHLFEVLILAAITQLVWQTSTEKRESGARVLTEDQVNQEVIAKVSQGTTACVKVLSGGLSSRFTLIAQIANEGVRVQVLAQDPRSAIDKEAASRLEKNLDNIVSGIHAPSSRNLVELRCYPGPASVRCIILYDRLDKPIGAYVGWYTYGDRGSKIRGYPNPTIACDADVESGRRLLKYAETEFERNLAEAGEKLL